MKKVLIIMLTVFALLPFTATTAFAGESSGGIGKKGNMHITEPIDPTESGISDNGGFFGEDELDGLEMLIQQKADKLDMNIFVFIAGSECSGYSDYKTECFSDDTYDELYGEDTDGVFYFVDLSTKKPAYDYISTSGKAVLMYQKHIQSIHNVCQSLLPPSSAADYSIYREDVANAVSQFLTQLDYYYNENLHGYYHDESSDKYFYYKGSNLVISYSPPLSVRMRPLIFALPIGIISAIIFYFAMKNKYKFKASVNPVAYVSHEETQFTRKDDRFIRTYTTKEKIESNSESGHSSGGGGHSHSGGHGGGGSHR
ncbi:MAG: hypothetical protein NC340_00960 [Ruminococcus flavefaciens]|nr:hypothetical protein [Ruminococcus flavefaciens]MCM1228718.1 hypothetical protein [Ruminococcus flavefaciens]